MWGANCAVKVLVSVPNGDGWYCKHVGRVLMLLLMDRRYRCTIIEPTWVPYEHNLNRIVKDLLTVYSDHVFWLTMDADNPPTRNPLDLISLDLDVIGFPTPVWANMRQGDQPYYYNAMLSQNDGWTPAIGDGLMEVDAVGSGCMLIHRRVCETMDKPLFVRQCDGWGVVERGHDYRFCSAAKMAGFRIWTHFDYPCHHFVNGIELGEVITAFREMQ